MVTAKRRGVSFEYKTAYIFRDFGYSWDRSGSSLGIDLKISKGGHPCYLVSCKKTSTSGPIYLPRQDVEQLKSAAKETGAKGLLCFGFHRSPVLALPVKKATGLERTRRNYKIYPTDGKPLKEILVKLTLRSSKR